MSSSSSVVNCSSCSVMRPNTLNVSRNGQHLETKMFIGEALNAWRTKARGNAVQADRLQELFHELQFNPSEKQIAEMLQTAKVFARKGSRVVNGLTFGEFCVLAADLKRFRTCNFSSNKLTSPEAEVSCKSKEDCLQLRLENESDESVSKASRSNQQCSKKQQATDNCAPEVFLGGSCNPTTWRADVAIPTLEKLGISFYNPQVSDWTPDLIELEHRAKEKARVLFFVMDSETRASAGAIEAAHIAGQYSKQLVLVLHPYKRDQSILHEKLSEQEYIDLSRNQQLLKELVNRRGLSVFDNIPSALHRTKQILAGMRDPPSNIASILIVARGAFDRVSNSSMDEKLTLQQCQRALSFLGYANSLLSMENLRQILLSQKEALNICRSNDQSSSTNLKDFSQELLLNFDEFCILAAYLSLLQQDIYENGCVSPIKGTNLQPPPIFLANLQEGLSIKCVDETITLTGNFPKHIFHTSSSSSVPEDGHNRDSGTSSPQPLEAVRSKFVYLGKRSKISLNVEFSENGEVVEGGSVCGEESDSNDSVFSSGSSINSSFCDSFGEQDFRDVYLGGSCFLRTTWRQEYAIPYLTSKGISYHLPALHESLVISQNNKGVDGSEVTATKEHNRTINCLHRNVKSSPPTAKEHLENLLQKSSSDAWLKPNLFNPTLLDSSRVLLFVITNGTRSLAPMTLAAHCIGLMYNVILCVQMLPEFCVIGNDRLTPTAIKDYNRGRSYLIDLAKRQGVPVFSDLKLALQCTVEKVQACNSRNSV